MAFTELGLESKSRELACEIYRLTVGFPSEERFGLSREIRRSAVSVGSNVAEGAGRSSPKEFARFVDISLGSLRELRFQLTVALNLGLAAEASITGQIQRCDGLRAGLIHYKRTLVQPGFIGPQ